LHKNNSNHFDSFKNINLLKCNTDKALREEKKILSSYLFESFFHLIFSSMQAYNNAKKYRKMLSSVSKLERRF
jgi:hypothetical protein